MHSLQKSSVLTAVMRATLASLTGQLKIAGSTAYPYSVTWGEEEPRRSAVRAVSERRRYGSCTCCSWREEAFPKRYRFYVGTHACLSGRLPVRKASQGWQNAKPRQKTQGSNTCEQNSRCTCAPGGRRRKVRTRERHQGLERRSEAVGPRDGIFNSGRTCSSSLESRGSGHRV